MFDVWHAVLNRVEHCPKAAGSGRQGPGTSGVPHQIAKSKGVPTRAHARGGFFGQNNLAIFNVYSRESVVGCMHQNNSL